MPRLLGEVPSQARGGHVSARPRPKFTIHVLHEGRALCPIPGRPSQWPLGNTSCGVRDIEKNASACADPEHELHAVMIFEMCAECMRVYEAGRPEVPDDQVRVQFIVYCNPADYPGMYVVRRIFITPGDVASRVSAAMAPHGTWRDANELPGLQTDRACVVAPTLEHARTAIPNGLTCIPRTPEDDPVIVEVWVDDPVIVEALS